MTINPHAQDPNSIQLIDSDWFDHPDAVYAGTPQAIIVAEEHRLLVQILTESGTIPVGCLPLEHLHLAREGCRGTVVSCWDGTRRVVGIRIITDAES